MDSMSTVTLLPPPVYTPPVGNYTGAALAQTAHISAAIAVQNAAAQHEDQAAAVAQQAQQRRLDAVTQAAQALQTYPLGDQKLANIYKDQSGQFIATYISLRDNSVSHVPEQTLLVRSAAAQQPTINLEV